MFRHYIITLDFSITRSNAQKILSQELKLCTTQNEEREQTRSWRRNEDQPSVNWFYVLQDVHDVRHRPTLAMIQQDTMCIILFSILMTEM